MFLPTIVGLFLTPITAIMQLMRTSRLNQPLLIYLLAVPLQDKAVIGRKGVGNTFSVSSEVHGPSSV